MSATGACFLVTHVQLLTNVSERWPLTGFLGKAARATREFRDNDRPRTPARRGTAAPAPRPCRFPGPDWSSTSARSISPRSSAMRPASRNSSPPSPASRPCSACSLAWLSTCSSTLPCASPRYASSQYQRASVPCSAPAALALAPLSCAKGDLDVQVDVAFLLVEHRVRQQAAHRRSGRPAPV